MFLVPFLNKLVNNIQIIAAIASGEELEDTLAFTSNFIPT